MPQKKGNTGNPNGRPKGSRNKVSGELRSMISEFLEGEFQTIKREFKRLSARDKAKLYTDLLNYALPKLQSTSLGFDFDNMSDEQLDKIIESLKESAKQDE
ncbi:DUF5681 domain-containing protein [Flavihumibacter sp. CACIAM 22H1]|uniref:DUF5681 domain-containing protein n=1 Tax=Flavihumibacter sp. CACIAM 22H1 TaxID=1812911 RepID=UPI000A5C1AFC|nr:DUF5681 domain-containing protein [Flavihumibacter sp. CACIAM 22H1]